MYDDIEIEVLKGGDKGVDKYTINAANINYYRGFTDDSSTLKTILYMQGSVKGIILNVGYEYFRKQLKRSAEAQSILMKLNNDQLDSIVKYANELKKKDA
jgi:hypothetical protein